MPRVTVHYQKDICSHFSTNFLADSAEEAEQRVRDCIRGESWYSVELDIPAKSILEDKTTIKIIEEGKEV